MKVLLSNLKRIFLIIRPYWITYGTSTMFVSSRNLVINLLNAWLFSSIAYAARIQDFAILKKSAIQFLSVLITFVLIDSISVFVQTISINGMIIKIRHSLYDRYLHIPMSKVGELGGNSGDILSRLNSDISLVENVFSFNLFYPIMLLISGIGGGISIFQINPIILIYLCAVGVGGLIIKNRLSQMIYQSYHSQQESFSSIMKLLIQAVSKFNDLRLLNAVASLQNHIMVRLNKLGIVLGKQVLINTNISFSTTILDIAGYIGTLVIGISLLKKGQIEIEEILFILQLSSMIIDMFLSFGDSIVALKQSVVGIERICEVETISVEETGCCVNMRNPLPYVNQIKADHLSILFPDSTVVNYPAKIEIATGKVTAIYGNSGCGKSTFARSLVGLTTNYTGTIQYCGKSIAKYDIATLRKHITYVPQKDYYVQGTLYDNLILGVEHSVSIEEVKRVACLLGCDKWISKLPSNYYSLISHEGKSLSGGQRQMLSIIRAVLNNSPTIIFDETLANIDTNTVSNILNGLKTLNRTIVIITHDNFVIDLCDDSIKLV